MQGEDEGNAMEDACVRLAEQKCFADKDSRLTALLDSNTLEFPAEQAIERNSWYGPD